LRVREVLVARVGSKTFLDFNCFPEYGQDEIGDFFTHG
jgi:hypothetical protein